MKIRPVTAELFHADRRTDGANSRFSQFCQKRTKSESFYIYIYIYIYIQRYSVYIMVLYDVIRQKTITELQPKN